MFSLLTYGTPCQNTAALPQLIVGVRDLGALSDKPLPGSNNAGSGFCISQPGYGFPENSRGSMLSLKRDKYQR